MMTTVMNTEEDVLRALKAKDFRSINKKQLMEFVSNIPNMDKEVAIHCIEQFPNFKEYTNLMVDHFYALCQSAVTDDGKAGIDAYRAILDDLRELMKDKNISEEERRYVIEQMVEIGEHIENAEKDKRHFKETVLKVAGAIAVVAIGVGGTILGISISPKDLIN